MDDWDEKKCLNEKKCWDAGIKVKRDDSDGWMIGMADGRDRLRALETEERRVEGKSETRDQKSDVRGWSGGGSERDHLRTIFNYDEIFGTIVNRFVVQAVVGYPLTVYGKGGQTRGYLNIKDTLQCVHMAEQKPAAKGELRVFNQIMETFSVNELAEMVQRVGKARGHDVRIDHIENPRKEAEEHYYNPTYQGLIELGVEPHYLTDEVLEGMFRVVERYKENIRNDVIFRGIRWG